MHHLPLNTGGGGGRQVITPLLGFFLLAVQLRLEGRVHECERRCEMC